MSPMTTDQNPHAARLEAILRLFLSATTDEELEQARAQAERVKNMSDEDVLALQEGDGSAEEPQPEGDFIQHLRQGTPVSSERDAPLAYAAPRIPAGHRVGPHSGGRWIRASELAAFLARLFTTISAAGRVITAEEAAEACAELRPHGWAIEEGEGGWQAVPVEGE